MTVRQADSPEWFVVRTGRITFSTAHSILHTDVNELAPSIIKRICTESKVRKSNVASLNWGKENEKNAINEFKTKLSKEHFNYQTQLPGLRLHKHLQYIGTSPDGLFKYDCNEEDFVMIEVKCP